MPSKSTSAGLVTELGFSVCLTGETGRWTETRGEVGKRGDGSFGGTAGGTPMSCNGGKSSGSPERRERTRDRLRFAGDGGNLQSGMGGGSDRSGWKITCGLLSSKSGMSGTSAAGGGCWESSGSGRGDSWDLGV
jgi:hypothetical protein